VSKPLDIYALLRRGGVMTALELEQLGRELTAAKLFEMARGVNEQTKDQPVKVSPMSPETPTFAAGYFTQQKFIWGSTPEEMESILGIFGKLQRGAVVLGFTRPLNPSDYENKAYTYLPDGREYRPKPNEKMYLPGRGAPQWLLTGTLPVCGIARVQPGQPFNRSTLLV
jgi:hypothetical protein